MTFRIEPDLKEALSTAADREHRSVANMLEVVIRDYCGRNGVSIHESEKLIARSRGRRAKGNSHARVLFRPRRLPTQIIRELAMPYALGEY